MRAATVFALSLAVAGAAAQTSTACSAQNIVDACVSSIKPRQDACGGNDWECLCTTSRDLATCYNNCPGTSDRAGVDAQVTSYCGAYSAAVSASAATAKTSTGSGSTGTTTTAATATGTATTTGTSTGTATDTGFASSSTTTGSSSAGSNAGGIVTPVKSFGALAGLMAIAGAFL